MKNIFSLLPKIMSGIILVTMTAVSLATAYIVFAPDAWPKPFYLVYQFPDPATEAASSENVAHAAESDGAELVPTPLPPAAPLEIRPGQGLMIDTGTKIVNLLDPTGRKYLRVGIVLEFAPTELAYYNMAGEEKTAYVTAFDEEINAKIPIINDVIISLLGNQTFDSVYTAKGKEDLRKELLSTINTQLPEYRVIFVYFTEFVVQ